ncbi:adenosylcobinamide-GDP ribazoletransferase [Catellatospora chokoriensis]|uniref:Adenosylcobinamide-GDP ribazoletransferase n=1 Tax=Catellatospora chokoriensis TaxID=310353 RepID=A0A8J3JXX9_9ACTN|nr:adenosylcobinamide-GDP ribazoletransferase [Catellatospora chokoriensis]GIF87018.1 adenosylcobinamide-GDP ribazoletransferase [Catellatospora chokoriensis]
MTRPSWTDGPRPRTGRLDGLRLALTTLTVAPVAGPRSLDRAVAGRAMTLAPAVGVLLGALLGGVLAALSAGLPALVAATLTVGLAALLSRGLHLDGLADTVDALGSYRSRERALEIMKSPEVGPFGVVALILVLLLQVGALAQLSARPLPALVAAVAAAVAGGRLAIAEACRRGVPAARPGGMGALVAGTVHPAAVAVAALAVAALAVPAVPHRPWQGPAAVLGSLLVVVGLRVHLVRRFGGVTGDVLGFLSETATTVIAIGLILF